MTNEQIVQEFLEIKRRLMNIEVLLSNYSDDLHERSTKDINMCEEALAELGDIIYAE